MTTPFWFRMVAPPPPPARVIPALKLVLQLRAVQPELNNWRELEQKQETTMQNESP